MNSTVDRQNVSDLISVWVESGKITSAHGEELLDLFDSEGLNAFHEATKSYGDSQ
jgi:hypothetical protein